MAHLPSTATEHAHGTATEHAVMDEEHVSLCYRKLGEDMLKHDLLPSQRNDPKYKRKYDMCGSVQLSKAQRSWISSLLTKNMGDKKLATYIWMHGLPRLFSAPVPRKPVEPVETDLNQ